MRKEGLLCTLRKPCPAAVAAGRQAKANKKQNHVRRAFRLHRPYDLVFTDVTYIDYGSGRRAYLSPILDCAGEVSLRYRRARSSMISRCWMISGRTPSMKGPCSIPIKGRCI
ncbi:MAG: hypothetical protein V8T10_06950 [Merdibacter sp.]